MRRKPKRARTGRPASRVQGRTSQSDLLRRALTWIINDEMFAELRLHGNTAWTPARLVILAILWTWSEISTLTGAFAEATHLSINMFGHAAITSYPGFTSALVTWTGRLMPLLWKRMQGLMEQVGGDYWRMGPWLPLAVDGSRLSTPRTRSNEEAFAAEHYGKGSKAKSRRKWRNKKRRSKRLSAPVQPQIWLTLIWHMGLKMPWCWKTGPSTSSERAHFWERVQTLVFPCKTLFCGDAGFVGYELWKGVLDAGHNFLIRVGGNVKLLRGLGHARCSKGLVYLWPDTAARKKQPPLILRLIEFQGARGRVYLVTNVLSEKALTARQAQRLYKLRWGVELQFRAFKQTFGRAKLHSRSALCGLAELEWSLVGLWSIQLFAVKEQIKVDRPPADSSVALALAVIQNAMRKWKSEASSSRELDNQLRDAIKDHYQRKRSKDGRYKPNYKDQPCATQPVVVHATAPQRKAYRALTASA